MDFAAMDINTITTGVTGDGVRYLELFLKEYTKLFGATVNPGCGRCMADYLMKYKQKMKKSENTSGWKLLEKYNGIPLEFGSQIFVTHDNVHEYGAQLLKNHPKGKDLFESIPEGDKDSKDDVSELEKLESAVEAAKEKISNQKPNTQQRWKDAAEQGLKDAEKALQDYIDANPDHEAANDIEVNENQE